jgi:putative endonuclease
MPSERGGAVCRDVIASENQNDWSVYLLRCADGTLYCGITNDIPRRLTRHAGGEVKYTRGRLPVELVWQEHCGDRAAASRREWEVKQLSRADKLALCSGA